MYQFISGYTAKVAGTEKGVTEPQPTFSTCFGAPFMVHHPSVYAELLGKKIQEHDVDCWLINTGWTGGSGAPGGTGMRFPIPVTRAIVAACQSGALFDVEKEHLDILNVDIPTSVPGVDARFLNPRKAWSDAAAYDAEARKLATLFQENIKKFAPSAAIVAAGPKA